MKSLHSLIVLLSLVFFQSCNFPAKKAEEPNFLFILVDDLGYHDLSCMGSEYYETPNIDRIAENGVRFLNGYANCEVCSPSRASILTGLYTTRHRITDYIGAPALEDWRRMNRYTRLLPASYAHYLDHSFITIPEVLKKAGYKTFFAGKWHLGSEAEHSLPTDHGFDINKGGYQLGGPYSGGYFAPFNNPYLEDRAEDRGKSLSMRLAEETSAFIRENRENKFFAYLAFYAVHAPIQTTEEKWSRYRDKAEAMGIEEEGFEMERILPIRKYQDNPVYAGLIEQVDDAVGLVLQTLKELGLNENTVVIFTSDNGGVASGDNFSTSSSPLRGGKGYQWEAGIRIPYFINVPWIEPKAKDNFTPVMGVDFLPTICELAGISLADTTTLDGVSIVPLLKGKNISPRPLFWHYPHYGNQGGEPNSIIQEKDWKLIHYWEDGRNELYDFSEDVGEKTDLSEEFPEITRDLSAKLMKWLDESGALYPEPDLQFNADSSALVLDRNKTRLLPRLEKQRHEMLKPGWKPNEDWWGSAVN